MKKTITTMSIVGSGLIIASSFDVTHSLVLFFLAGVIPGTDIILTPLEMMAASATAMTIVILRIVAWPRFARVFFLEPPVSRKRQTSRAKHVTA